MVNLVAPSFEITKTSNATSAGWYQGQTNATYSLTIQNVGGVGNNDPALTVSPVNNALKEVFVLDSLPTGITPNWIGTLSSGIFTCTYVGQNITCRTTTNIAPSSSTTLTIPISITSATNGSLTNYASVGGGFDPYNNGTPPTPNSCTPATNKHCTSLAVDIKNPVITVTKSASPAAGTAVTLNDEITYTLTATITNNPSLSNLKLTDVLPTGLEFVSVTANSGGFTNNYATDNSFVLPASPTKAPGTYSISFKAKVTEAAAGLGNLVNTVTPTGGSPIAPTCTPNCSTTHPVSISSLTLTKTASQIGASLSAVGDQIEFEFVIENTGDTVINNISIADAFLTAASVTVPSVTSLAAGATTTVSAIYTLTAADFAAGKVDNKATASGTDTANKPVTSNESSTSTPLTAAPSLSLKKTAGVPSGQTVGSTMVYTFSVSNTGNVNLTNITITDPLLSAANVTVPTIASLAAGATTAVTATYTLTAADFVAAKVDNSATAEGKAPDNSSVPSDPSTTSTPLTQNPVLTLQKTAGTPSGDTVGSTVEYTFTVKNEGNLPMTDVTISDSMLAVAGVTLQPITSLPVGATQTITATYTLTSADFNAGRVENTAQASGIIFNGADVPSNTSTAVVNLTQNPGLSVLKTGSTPSGTTIGSTITYSFEVTNGGNVDLTNVTLNDPMLTSAGVTVPAVGNLAAGQTKTVTAVYTLTEADFTQAKVENTVTVTGNDPSNTPVTSPPSSVTIPLNQIPSLSVTKTAGTPTGQAAGITLPSIGTLAPGASSTVSATYTLTAADFNNGRVVNTAVAKGEPPVNPSTPTPATPITSPPSETDTPLNQNPGIKLTKSAGAPSGQTLGSTITYTFLVENTGNVDLTNVEINDTKFQAAGVSVPPIPQLGIGKSTTVTATYTLTQADLDQREVVNTATATAQTPSNTPITSTPSTTRTPLTPDVALVLKKTSSGLQGTGVGATVTYTLTVTNTGTTNLSNVTIDDTLLMNACIPVPDIGDLAPNQTKSVSAVYTLTQDDINKGVIENIAIARGTDKTNQPVTSNIDETRTFIDQFPELSIKKRANAPKTDTVGDLVEYIFDVSNTGNVRLTDIRINDPMLAAAGVSIPLVGTLNPGEQRTVIATYQLVQPDFDRGYVENVATASGTPPNKPPIESPPSNKVIYLTPTPRLSLTKTLRAGPSPVSEVGQVLTYTITVKNVGNMNLGGIALQDALNGLAQEVGTPRGDAGEIGILNVDEEWLYTTFYTVTQADLDSKTELRNIATVKSATTGANTPPPADVVVPVRPSEIDATDDQYVVDGRTFVNDIELGNVLTNDTLNKLGVDTGSVVMTVTTPATPINGTPVPYLNPDTGRVVAPKGASAGRYEIRYRICERYNPNNCDDAVVIVDISNVVIAATDDNYSIDNTFSRTPLGNVLGNDSLDKNPATLSNISLHFDSVNHAALRLDEATGFIHIASDAPPGEYILHYHICDKTNPSICASAIVKTRLKMQSQIRLSKKVMTPRVKIGDIVRYTLVGQNVSFSALENIELIDTPPPGFTYVENSIRIEDQGGRATLTNPSPLRIAGLTVNAGAEFVISYALRVGPGAALNGEYTNTAYAGDQGSAISNTATATVIRAADPLFEDARVFGSVYHDRNSDGWQAGVMATNVNVKGGFSPSAYVPNSTTLDTGNGPEPVPDASAPLLHGMALGDIDSIFNHTTPRRKSSLVISQLLTHAAFTDDFELSSAEGAKVRLSQDGTLTRSASGEVKRKRNSQQLYVERSVYPADKGLVRVEYYIDNRGSEERGIPGIRLGTVEGLIVITDAYGRFHLEGLAPEHIGRGKNIAIKVDTATLPAHAKLTTPNPQVVRMTEGLGARFDFGIEVHDPRTQSQAAVVIDLDASLFSGEGADLAPDADASLVELTRLSREHETLELRLPTRGTSATDQALALQRAHALLNALKVQSTSTRVTLATPDDVIWASLDAQRLIVSDLSFLNQRDQLTALLTAFIKHHATGSDGPIRIVVGDPNKVTGGSDLQEARDLYDALTPSLTQDERARVRIRHEPVKTASQGGNP